MTASVEELAESSFYTGTLPNTTGTMVPVMVAKYDLVVKACSIAIMNPDGGVAANNTNYWRVSLVRLRADASATIAQKTTQVAPTGAAIPDRRSDWNFDAITFNTTSAACQPGDIVALLWEAIGTTPTAPIGVVQTVRYEPAP